MVEKISVLGLDGKEKETIELPNVFNIKPRLDLIRRAVVSIEAAQKHPQGRDPLAGKRNTAKGWGTGFASARVPRLQGSGYPSSRNAAFAPFTVGGRVAHPPRAEKVTTKKINRKEKRVALLSAISATGNVEFVKKRGHIFNENLSIPIVIDDKLQTIKKTAQIIDIFESVGLESDLIRVKEGKSVRAGKGKRRGRKYKNKKGPLLVIKDDFGVYKATRNIPGVDVVHITNINCSLLAPGTHCGRLTIWTQSAFKELYKMDGEN